jgi:bacterioferritin-associated ferredoxin
MDTSRIICQCNDLTFREVVDFIKENRITSLRDLVEDMPVGDKCESCVVDGFEDDGFSLSKALREVEAGNI